MVTSSRSDDLRQPRILGQRGPYYSERAYTILQSVPSVVLCLTIACTQREPPVKQVAPTDITPGPIVHAALPSSQRVRIERVQKVFAEVDPTPLAQWVEDFSRDQHPEREIRLWEAMAASYTQYSRSHTLGLDAKKEAFGLLLKRSGQPQVDVLQHAELKFLTQAEATELLDTYHEPATPVVIQPK